MFAMPSKPVNLEPVDLMSAGLLPKIRFYAGEEMIAEVEGRHADVDEFTYEHVAERTVVVDRIEAHFLNGDFCVVSLQQPTHPLVAGETMIFTLTVDH